MGETERESLVRYAWIIEDWTPERIPDELASAFFNLSDLDKTKNLDLWEAVRKALVENEHLKDEEIKDYLNFETLVEEGCWWADPEQWETVKLK